MKSVLVLEKIETSSLKDGMVRINFTMSLNDKTEVLYYEVDSKYKEYLSSDRGDAAIIAVLLYAIRFGYDIKLNVPISETLYYHLYTQVIPQLCSADKKCKEIKIEYSTLLPKYTDCKNAVGTGISLGVDSMATLKEYNDIDIPDSYKITHLTYHEVGAHHGMDVGVENKKPLSSKELFDGQLKKVEEFCDEYGYELVVIRSNIQNFLRTMFPRLSFHTNCTYRNVSAILILQKLFGKFYCASAFNLDEFECDSEKDSEKYEKFLLPYISTENTKFYNSNKNWNRMKKVELLSDFKPSYDYLTVCLTHVNNCGKCMKCKRTLLNLDVVGSIEKYKKSFDVEHYKKYDREDYLKLLWRRDNYDPFLREILEYALKNKFEELPLPEIEYFAEEKKGKINKINLRKYPSSYSEILLPNLSDDVIIEGGYHGWYYVTTSNGTKGFCYGDFVEFE